jgi:L-ascorbate metabolism protein UlaG (beta-lactamase superfamily)
MKVRQLILTAAFCIISIVSFAQAGKIDITFIGNCGFFMTDGNIKLYVDFPYKSGAYGYMTYDSRVLDSIREHSIFLFTHGHADHYNRKLFRMTHQKLYAPYPVKVWLSAKRKCTLKELNASMPNFQITEFQTKHRLSLKHYSYLIVWNNIRIYLSGDTETADKLCEMKNLDLVIAPTWVIHDARNRDLKIDTKKILLCHHRSKEKINNQSPDKIIIPVQNQHILVNW